MTQRILPLAVVVMLSLPAAAKSPSVVRSETFLPDNDMRIEVNSSEAKGISEKQFNHVMDVIEKVYGPVIAARGGKLVLHRLWDDSTVNASAQRSGDDYILNMYGGLARHEDVSEDGMTVVACHELGHHLGGAPKKWGGWASNEGQSDYFANLKCMRRVFADPAAADFSRPKDTDDQMARASCNAAFAKRPHDVEICVRSTMASVSLAHLLAGGGTAPHLGTPSTEPPVETTDNSHPAAQCRLDTYWAAAICKAPMGEDVDDKDPNKGACTKSRGYKLGLRPTCWYKPEASEGVAGEMISRQGPIFKDGALSSLRAVGSWQGL